MATESELSRDADAALEAVDARMIEAEKDRRFVEAMRRHCDEFKPYQATTWPAVHVIHQNIYGTPCTASAKTEGK